MQALERDLAEKLNALDIETSYEEDVLFAVIRGGASLPDSGMELALTPLEVGLRSIAVRAQHLSPLHDPELPDPGGIEARLKQVREECLFARAVVLDPEQDDDERVLLIDACFLLPDLRFPQIQTLLNGLTLFAEEILLTIGTLYYNEPHDKEKN